MKVQTLTFLFVTLAPAYRQSVKTWLSTLSADMKIRALSKNVTGLNVKTRETNCQTTPKG